MRQRIFVVSHPKAKYPLTIAGETLEIALKKEALNPLVWQLVEELKPPPRVNFGENH